MNAQSFIVEAWSNEWINWSSHTILNSDIETLRFNFGDQCNIIQISPDQAQRIQEAPSKEVAGLINNILMNTNSSK